MIDLILENGGTLFIILTMIIFCSQLVADCDLDCKLSTSDDHFNEQEEELRHRVQLEAEERKLEETLEYQQRIEKEGKQKHFAEQFRSSYASSVVGPAGLSSTNRGQDNHLSASDNSSLAYLEGIKFGDFRYSEVPLQEHSSYTENNFREKHNGLDSPGAQALTNSDMNVSKLTLRMNGIWKNAQHIKSQGNPSIQKPKKSTNEPQKQYVQGLWIMTLCLQVKNFSAPMTFTILTFDFCLLQVCLVLFIMMMIGHPVHNLV